MRPLRALCGSVTIAVAVMVLHVHGQGPVARQRVLIDRFAPSAIEGDNRPDRSRAPDSPETQRRLSLRTESALGDRTDSHGRHYVPGQLIVKFRDSMSTAARLAAVSAVSRTARMAARPSYADFDVVTIDAMEDAEVTAGALAERVDVEYAQPSYRMRPKFKPNDQYYADQWNLPMIGMESAWDIQPAAGSEITVAVLDTGVAYTNVTLAFRAGAFTIDSEGNVGPPNGRGVRYPALGNLQLSFVAATELGPSTRFVSPHDFIWDDDTPVDLDGHGTHVSGTIGQLTNNGTNGTGDTRNAGGTAGIAFNVKIMPVKVISTEWDDIFASPHVGTDDVVARGIRYAADNGAKIINMSFGENGDSSQVLESAMRYAVGKGVFMAISAGNEYEEGNPTEIPASIAARVNGAVSVAAVDQSKSHAFYSNTGSWVEIAAPGGSFRGFDKVGGVLQQTLDLAVVETFLAPVSQFTAPRFDALAYYYFTGTSMAAPHVSGLAAMLMQQGITDPAAVEAAIEKFADDLGAPGRDDTFGFGLINARKTLFGLGLASENLHDDRTVGAGTGVTGDRAASSHAAGTPRAAQDAAPASSRAADLVPPFVMGAIDAFAAAETFRAIFGKSYGAFFGGGLQVAFHGKYYVEVGASRFQQTGQRAFRNNGQDFSLGIPLTATVTPLEITGGYRFRPRQMPRLRPYLGAGLTSYAYTETSAFAAAGEDLTTRHAGLVGVGGLEFRVHRYVGIGGDVELAHVTGILGQSGISKDVGESNLGGISARFRLILGR